jgi:hypothetical protein
MGIFLYEKKLWAQNDDFKFQRGHINFNGVNDPAKTVSVGSLTPLKFEYCRFFGDY